MVEYHRNFFSNRQDLLWKKNWIISIYNIFICFIDTIFYEIVYQFFSTIIRFAASLIYRLKLIPWKLDPMALWNNFWFKLYWTPDYWRWIRIFSVNWASFILSTINFIDFRSTVNGQNELTDIFNGSISLNNKSIVLRMCAHNYFLISNTKNVL